MLWLWVSWWAANAMCASNRPRDNIEKCPLALPSTPSAFFVYVLLFSLAPNARTKLPSQRHSAEFDRFYCIIYGVAWVEFCSRFYNWCRCQILIDFESNSNEEFRFWMYLTLFVVGCVVYHLCFVLWILCEHWTWNVSLISHARSHKQKVIILHVNYVFDYRILAAVQGESECTTKWRISTISVKTILRFDIHFAVQHFHAFRSFEMQSIFWWFKIQM